MAQPDTLRTLIQASSCLSCRGFLTASVPGWLRKPVRGRVHFRRGLSETLLGYSDVGLMGFELNLAGHALAACCTLPLLADATPAMAMRSTSTTQPGL